MRRFSIFALLVLMMSAVMGGAAAQDMAMEQFCGDLAEADCELLRSANDTMSNVSEAEFTLNLQLSQVGEAPAGEEPIPTITLNLDGAFERDVAALQAAQEAGTQDMSAAMEAAQQGLQAVNAQVTITLNVEQPAGAAQPMPFPPEGISVEARYLSGTGYINFSDLESFLPDVTGWHGLNLIEALQSDMFSGMMQQMPEQQTQQTDDVQELARVIEENADQFMTIERLADETLDGIETAVFLTTVDLEAFFEIEEVREAVREQIRSQSPQMSEEELNQMMETQLQMLQGVIFENRQYVGMQENYIYRSTVDMEFTVPEDSGQMEGSGPTLNFNAQLDYRNFGNAAEIAAPEDATLHTLQEVFGMLLGGMGGMGDGGGMMPPTPAGQ